MASASLSRTDADIPQRHLLVTRALRRASDPLDGVPMCMAANAKCVPVSFLEEDVLARIPQVLHEHINTAYPANVCLIGTVLPNGFAQITPRGSTMVFDDEHIALWERGKGTTTGRSHGRDAGHDLHAQAGVARGRILPKGGILRLYGRAKFHKSGAVYGEILCADRGGEEGRPGRGAMPSRTHRESRGFVGSAADLIPPPRCLPA